MTAQLLLMMRDADRAVMASVRVREAARIVADELGRKTLADDWGCTSEAKVADKISQRDRHYLKPDELLDLILRDCTGRILAAICDEAGYEAPERKRILEPGEKLERLEKAADELFGPEVAELLRRKAGLL